MNYADIESGVISRERLTAFGLADGRPLPECMALYVYNMQLCEALYPLLHGVEIALRNRTHAALAAFTGRKRWMNADSSPILRQREKASIKRAENFLRRKKKPTNVESIISELSLGFWVSLYGEPYDRPLWHKGLLRDAFPCAPRSALAAHRIRSSLRRIRHLRNRVFHHEPIWQWRSLAQHHREILRLTFWLSSDWSRILVVQDRFPQVLAAGEQVYVARINSLDGAQWKPD